MAKKKSKTSKKSSNGNLSPELIELIRVTDEDREKALGLLRYTVTPRPEGKKKPKGKLWCVYCGDWNKFTNKRGSEFIYKRCEECNISEEDFWIKKHNGLFKLGKTK